MSKNEKRYSSLKFAQQVESICFSTVSVLESPFLGLKYLMPGASQKVVVNSFFNDTIAWMQSNHHYAWQEDCISNVDYSQGHLPFHFYYKKG